VNANMTAALTGFLPAVLPEAVLGLMACIIFLGGTFKMCRRTWGTFSLLSLALAGVALWVSLEINPPVTREVMYAAPVQLTGLAVALKIIALVGAAVLVLLTWDDVPSEHAAEFQGCMLLLTAGASLTGAANDLITLFLALELVSIPTYVMLYLPRDDAPAQEAAMKYFLLSVFSSGLFLFGLSYLYGLTGTTNIPALTETLAGARDTLALSSSTAAKQAATWPGMALVAVVLVVAGLGFRITAVPFHFYAPDVYQGTSTGMAALLAFVPKLVGFGAMVTLLGFVKLSDSPDSGKVIGDQLPVLLWIISAVTMSLGNGLALLQDNVKRMLAYSSVAHAGYMLIGLTVAPFLGGPGGSADVGGVEAVFFYLVAYGSMTTGAFAVLHYLSSGDRPVESIDDLAGVARTNPVASLLMALFLFSLIGIPLTGGFNGKFLLFLNAFGLSSTDSLGAVGAVGDQAKLYRILAIIAVVNAAIGAWYYLRVCAVMFLREPVYASNARKSVPLWVALIVCAVLTLGLGVFPDPLLSSLKKAVNGPTPVPTTAIRVGD
jgi:NADH-quinone oxidoreductase subunit N